MHWIRRHTRGRPPHPDVLTPAEWRVVDLARAGHSNPAIAEQLGITVSTVKTHMSRILNKLDLPDRRALAGWDGRPAVSLPRRSGVFAPLAWLGSKATGAVAVTALVGVLMVGFAVAMESGRVTGGVDPTPTATVTATPPAEVSPGGSLPTFAPDGRTGNAVLDDLIESLLQDDAEALARRHAGASARGRQAQTDEDQTYRTEEWTARLAGADRSLYAVFEGDEAWPPREFEIVLEVTEAGAEPVGWSFAVDGQSLVDILMGSLSPSNQVPGVARQHDRYLVLPPPDTLPTSPPGHDVAVRSGDAGVDALLALVEARDAGGLSNAVGYEQQACEAGSQLTCPSGNDSGQVDALRLRACNGNDSWISRQSTEVRLERIASVASAVHAVVQVPEGYLPDAEHLIILVTRVAPYRWESAGMFERDGQIVGLYTQCYGHPQGMFPPRAFVLAPPADPASLNSERTSGVAAIDESLAALRSADVSALDALADWGQVGCVTVQNGVDAPPLCEPGEPPGSLIDALPVVSCEGGPRRRAEVGQMLADLASDDWTLYRVSDIGPPAADWMFPPGSIEAVLVRTASAADGSDALSSALVLSFTEEGFASVQFPCGPTSPESFMSPGRAPSFLLAPPP